MTPETFCYWLQGLFEVGKPKALNAEQVEMIKEHLALVFVNVTKQREEAKKRIDETRAQHDETQSRVREVLDALQKKSADPRRARVVLPVDPSKVLIC